MIRIYILGHTLLAVGKIDPRDHSVSLLSEHDYEVIDPTTEFGAVTVDSWIYVEMLRSLGAYQELLKHQPEDDRKDLDLSNLIELIHEAKKEYLEAPEIVSRPTKAA